MTGRDSDSHDTAGIFRDRADAGRRLGAYLSARLIAGLVADRARPQGSPAVVLGLARGGLPVAAEVAAAIEAPLDVLVVRKLGAPSQPEFAFGAIAENEATFVNAATVDALGLAPGDIDRVLQRERAETTRRILSYRGNRPLAGVRGRHVVLVDDGLATGATMRAAVLFAQERGAATITVAVPVGAPETVDELRSEVHVVCLRTPEDFGSVGYWYADFDPPSDDEIRALLR